jgi:hypothetical protein
MPRMQMARANRSSLLWGVVAIVACTNPSYTIVHIDVKPQPGITLDSYDIRVAEFEHSMPPNNAFDLVVPDDAIGQPTAIVVEAMDRGSQVAYGSTMVTPSEGATTDVMITLASSSCSTSCTAGETVCSGEATITCTLGSNGCYGWSTPKACPSSAPFCSEGTCAAHCSNECSQVGQTDCDGAAVRTCQSSSTDSCLHWSVPIACNAPPAAICESSSTLRTYGAGTCTSGACAYPPSDQTCQSPANGVGECSNSQCGYTCNPGFQDDGMGDCIAGSGSACPLAFGCGSDADCGPAACGPCSQSICLGAAGI